MKTIIGIDPGITGAVSFITDGKLTAAVDMPIIPDGKGKKNKVDGAELKDIILQHTLQLDDWPENCHVYLERVGAMRGQGVTSMFSFGRSFGAVEGVVTAMGLPLTYITPQQWKKRAGLIGAEKDASRGRAVELYPNADVRRKKDSGRADAILIAHFGEQA